ncbi:MAG: hypothetical protein RIT81_00210 [Deltaproteobacteria bacterium]
MKRTNITFVFLFATLAVACKQSKEAAHPTAGASTQPAAGAKAESASALDRYQEFIAKEPRTDGAKDPCASCDWSPGRDYINVKGDSPDADAFDYAKPHVVIIYDDPEKQPRLIPGTLEESGGMYANQLEDEETGLVRLGTTYGNEVAIMALQWLETACNRDGDCEDEVSNYFIVYHER